MTDKIEIQGKTVDAAVSEALLQMGARRDEVEIKVLEEPKSGFLGVLGGRPARVLVRMKRGRRGGGRGQDHRQDQDGYQFGGDKSRDDRSRGRRGGGRKGRKDQDEDRRESRGGRDSGGEGKRDDSRDAGRRGGRGRGRGGDDQAQSQEARSDSRRDGGPDEARDGGDGERKRTRRGSRGGRGRGGRGRKPEAAAVDQGKNQGRNGDQTGEPRRESARRDDDRNDRSNQRQERSRRDQRGSEGRDRAPESREDQRQERSRRDRRPAAAEVERDDAGTPAPAGAVRSVNELYPIRRAGDVGKDEAAEAAPAPAADSPAPGKKKTFGGLGARRKSKLASESRKAEAREASRREASRREAEQAEKEDTGMDAAARRAAERPGEIRRKGSPEGEGAAAAPASRPPRRESRDIREPGDDVIIEGVEATSYAGQVDAPADEAALDTLKELASGMLARAGFPCDVDTRPDEYTQVLISTDEENAGMLIGRHGQTVEAVEHLVERMASNLADDRVRMNLDINDYRVRRHEALLERTREAIDEVLESGRACHMEPMSARERRIVHMGCADVEGIRTFTMMGSRGKQVVIAVDDGSPEESNDDPVFTDG